MLIDLLIFIAVACIGLLYMWPVNLRHFASSTPLRGGFRPFHRRLSAQVQGDHVDAAMDGALTACNVYTAASCDPDPGRGRWAYVRMADGARWEESGEQAHTTAMRMALTAAVKALEATEPGSVVVVHTQSELVQQGMASWVPAWLDNGWRSSSGQPIENRNLWEALARLAAERTVKWKCVRADGVTLPANGADCEGDRALGHVIAPGATVDPTGMDGESAGGDTGMQVATANTQFTLTDALGHRPDALAPLRMGEGADTGSDGSASPAASAATQADTDDDDVDSAHDTGEELQMSVQHMELNATTRQMAGVSTSDRRRAIMAEAQALERRWGELYDEVQQLDQEWQRCLEYFRDGRESTDNGQPPNWADGALLYSDLNTHAARTSVLADEALQTCQQYALALQRAMDGMAGA